MNNVDLNKVLVFDIETARQHDDLAMLKYKNPFMHGAWDRFNSQNSNELEYVRDAGLYPEFGRIVSIGICVYKPGGAERQDCVYSISLTGDDEKRILESCNNIMAKYYWAGGHNIRNFDVPYYARRCMINGLNVPSLINPTGKKPWEVNMIDTKQIWQYGGIVNQMFSDPHVICSLLGIKNEKDPDFGSKVSSLFHSREFDTIASESSLGAEAQMKMLIHLGEFNLDAESLACERQNPKFFMIDRNSKDDE